MGPRQHGLLLLRHVRHDRHALPLPLLALLQCVAPIGRDGGLGFGWGVHRSLLYHVPQQTPVYTYLHRRRPPRRNCQPAGARARQHCALPRRYVRARFAVAHPTIIHPTMSPQPQHIHTCKPTLSTPDIHSTHQHPGSCVATFLLSKRLRGHFSMVDVQNATLAGGVAVGSTCNMDIHPGCVRARMAAGG